MQRSQVHPFKVLRFLPSLNNNFHKLCSSQKGSFLHFVCHFFLELFPGFKGIWGSGLSISAQLGVRDSNEASWTQVLEVMEFMSDATDIPILLDADTGYGNFNNARRLVTKLEQRGVAGACIEDKLFPKTNSLLDGREQPLADIDEFCAKIKACKGTATLHL